MAVTEAGTRVKEAAAGSTIVRPGRPPTTGIAATGNGFVEVLRASPTLGMMISVLSSVSVGDKPMFEIKLTS